MHADGPPRRPRPFLAEALLLAALVCGGTVLLRSALREPDPRLSRAIERAAEPANTGSLPGTSAAGIAAALAVVR